MSSTVVVATLLLVAVGQPVSYVRNGGFERGTMGWQIPAGAKVVEREGEGQCLLVLAGAGRQVIWRRAGWRRMSVAVDIQATEVVQDEPEGFAFAAVYQYDDSDTLLAFKDFVQLREPAAWKRYEYTFTLHPETAQICLHFGFYRAHGRAFFDNWTLVVGEKAARMDEVQEGANGRGDLVVIWDEPDVQGPAGSLDAQWCAGVLHKAGIRAEVCGTGSVTEKLLAGEAAVLVLPHGAVYPHRLRRPLIEFCRAGGKLLVVGGYPLNEPMVKEEGRWVSWREVLAKRRQQALAWPNTLLGDGGFEKSAEAPVGGKALDGKWHRDDPRRCRIVQEQPFEGRWCARVDVGAEEPELERRWYAWLPTRPGRKYVFSARIRTQNVSGPGFAYVAVYQYRGDKLVKHRDVLTLRGDNPWREAAWAFKTEATVDAIFIKMGLYRARGTAWFDRVQLVDVTELDYRPLNTSSAPPGDGLHTAAYQMGMCDADFPLERAVAVKPAEGQWVMRRVAVRGRVSGWAAVGVVGYSAARWVPLLDALDRYGRLRGAAGALMIHYGGFYSGSMWAYFGVEDRQLFGPQVAGSEKDLVGVVRFLLRGVALNRLKCEYDSYSPGEEVAVTVAVSNSGAKEFSGEVQVSLAGSTTFAVENVEVAVAAGTQEEVTVRFRVPERSPDLVKVRARLVEGAQPIDEMVTGFVVRRPDIVARAPRLTFADNYFRLDGRPVFLFGSDNYSNDYKSDAMNPLRWDEIQALARDMGLQVYENLQYSNPGHNMTEKDWRAFQAMGQLLQKRGLVFMCGLLIGHNVAVDDEELQAEGRQCFEYARRLRGMPALLWYINGDYQLRYRDVEFLRRAWNDWLRREYGSTQALRAAWGRPDAPELGNLPFPPKTSGKWDDRVRIDQVRFNVWLMRRWNENHVREIRRADRRHAITSEYYSEPWFGIDQRQTIDGQDVANFGFFSLPGRDLEVLPERLAINDMRAVGKGVSMGEYGCKTHPAWTKDNGARGYHIVRTREQRRQLFVAVAAYALGMGAAKIQNWCLRDADERVFPWGYLYAGRNVPKDVAYVHRNLSMMWRLIEPRYEPPSTTVVATTALRVGNHDGAGRQAVYGAAQALLRLHIPFNVIDDFDLSRVPPESRVLVWPVAVAVRDEDFDAALAWARKGGQLVFSGLPGWDEARGWVGARRVQAALGVGRIERLFSGVSRDEGPKAKVTLPSGGKVVVRPQAAVADAGQAECIARAEDGTAVLLRRRLGKGTVVWVVDPIELGAAGEMDALCEVYASALAQLPKPPKPIPVRPDSRDIHAMRQRTASGWAYVLFDTRRDGSARRMRLATKAGEIECSMRPRWPAVFMVSDDGRVLLALAAAPVKVNERTLIDGVHEQPLLGLASLDGQDLAHSRAVMVCPFGAGKWRVLAGKGGHLDWGEWRDGTWHALDSASLGGSRWVVVGEDLATLVGLVCAQAEAARWRRGIEDLAVHVWRLRGY